MSSPSARQVALTLALATGILLVAASLAAGQKISARKPVLVTAMHARWAGELDFSPDGTLLGMVSQDRVVVFDPRKDVEVASVGIPGGGVCEITDAGCVFSPDGTLFAALRNQDVVVLDIAANEIILHRSMSGFPFGSVGPAAFTADEKQLVIGGQCTQVFVLDIQSSEVVPSGVLAGGVVSIRKLPTDDLFAVGHFSGGVDVWNVESDRVEKFFPGCGTYSNSAEAWGDFLLIGCGAHEIRLWDIHSNDRPIGSLEYPFLAHTVSVARDAGIVFGASGKARAEEAEGPAVPLLALFDLVTRERLTAWAAHDSRGILETAISSDGKLMASLGYDGELKVWRWPPGPER